jgi:putative tricarboxylic transport membrane protein
VLKTDKSLQAVARGLLAASALVVGAGFATEAAAEWAPTKTVEFIVPAGTGGGADQMARMLQGIIQKHGLMDQSMVVINKSGGAGAEGFLDVKASAGNPHKIVITLSNVFTTPLATGVPFSWDELTPVSMLALDNFILWVNAESPYQTAQEYIEAVKAGSANEFKMGGTGSKQEDQIITAAIEQSTGAKFTYIPFKGGGDVAAQLVGNHIDSSVNNPIEAVSHWDGGALRPLCVFGAEPIAIEKWKDVPTCKSAGLDVEYQMLRGIFMPPDVEPDAVAFYVDLFGKARETPEWQEFMQNGAFTQTTMSGEEFQTWLGETAEKHKELMTGAGFIATN